MTIRNAPSFLQGLLHPAENVRALTHTMFGPPASLFTGGITGSNRAHGVGHRDDLKVTQRTGLGLYVLVGAGGGLLHGSEDANQGAYGVWNDGPVELPVTSPDLSYSRNDIVGVRVRDHNYSGIAADDGTYLVVVAGTPSGTPADPTVPDNFLPLARVVVAPGTTDITNAMITDLRPRLPRGWTREVSTARPTTPSAGDQIFELDTLRWMGWNSGAWVPMRIPVLATQGAAFGTDPPVPASGNLFWAAGSKTGTADGNGRIVADLGTTFSNGIVACVPSVGDMSLPLSSAGVYSITGTQVTFQVLLNTVTGGVINPAAGNPVRVNWIALGW